jgi:hypothetical protein
MNWVHPNSLKVLQLYQKHNKKCHGLEDFNMTKQTNYITW